MWALHLRLFILLALAVPAVRAQTLNVPPRAATALTGQQFSNVVATLGRDERENWIQAQFVSGNVPAWLRTLKPINVAAGPNTGTFHVSPDYLAVGSDQDYFLMPMTPLLAQRLANQLGGALPTRKMVNHIWTNAAVKLSPQSIAPSAEMITVPVFGTHNGMVRTSRSAFTNAQPLGALVSGDKKDVVVSAIIYSNLHSGVPRPVVIYGWHYTSGSPIQPLYNGHEETYADYSHGIRWVQMAMTVNGTPDTVTNVLSTGALAALLSDEGTLAVPRYTVAAQPPVVMTHPRGQTVSPGSDVTFSGLAIGDGPPAVQWQFNGAPLPGATHMNLTLTNVLAAQAGAYAFVASNAAGLATSRVALLRWRASDFPALFADDFETDTATNWTVRWAAANGLPDYTATFAFDYGATPYTFNGVTALIPPAPGSPDGSTRGLRLTVNGGDTNGANAAVNVYPNNFSVSGDFALKFDLWLHYPGDAAGANSAGSTQFAQSGVHHTGTNVNWPASTRSDGLWFAVDGEGGTSADYRAYAGNLGGAPTDLSGNLAASGLVATNSTAAVFQNLFPATRFETAGSPGKQWVEVELRQRGGQLTWLLDGIIVAQRTNTTAFTNGTFMLGLMDVFPSIASPARDSFALFDNVRVENLAPPVMLTGVSRSSEGVVGLAVSGSRGDSFWLERSTNLNQWQAWQPIQLTNATVSVTDSNATSETLFYRTRR